MTRALRPDPVAGWHHVMNRGVNRAAIFLDDLDRREFEEGVAVVCRRYGAEIHAYCLMTNHFHLLVHCPDGGVSAAVHDLTGTYARRFNNRWNRVGHLFGDRFTSRLVTSNRYITNAVRYIHRNCLDIGGVEACLRYRWSSHRTYLGLERQPAWLRTDRILNWFTTRNDYARFVDGDAPPVAPDLPPVGQVLDAVDFVIAEKSDLGGRRTMGQRRALAIAVADQTGDRRLLDSFEFASNRAENNARWRSRKHFVDRPDDRRLITDVAGLIGLPERSHDSAA